MKCATAVCDDEDEDDDWSSYMVNQTSCRTAKQ